MKLTAEYGSKLTYLYVEMLLDGQSRAICNNWTLRNLNDQGLTVTSSILAGFTTLKYLHRWIFDRFIIRVAKLQSTHFSFLAVHIYVAQAHE